MWNIHTQQRILVNRHEPFAWQTRYAVFDDVLSLRFILLGAWALQTEGFPHAREPTAYGRAGRAYAARAERRRAADLRGGRALRTRKQSGRARRGRALRHRFVAQPYREGPAAARHPSGSVRELRADPPV